MVFGRWIGTFRVRGSVIGDSVGQWVSCQWLVGLWLAVRWSVDLILLQHFKTFSVQNLPKIHIPEHTPSQKNIWGHFQDF